MMEYDKVMQAMPSEADRQTLVALPYRIGLYVSHADVTGGWEAQDSEMQSLTHILRSFTEDFCKSEFVQGLLMKTLVGRTDWPAWSQNLGDVPGECVAVMYDLRGVLDLKHVVAFQEQMMDIAFAVAQAWREDKTPPPVVVQQGLFSRLFASKKDDRYSHLNVSQYERMALERLADALDYS